MKLRWANIHDGWWAITLSFRKSYLRLQHGRISKQTYTHGAMPNPRDPRERRNGLP